MDKTDLVTPFDSQQVLRNRRRAAANISEHDFLLRNTAAALVERVHFIAGSFKRVAEIGSGQNLLRSHLEDKLAKDALWLCLDTLKLYKPQLVCEPESLPLAPACFDLILSNLVLHWINDLPGLLAQVRMALIQDGVFIATLFGGTSLAELRACLIEAESKLWGGVHPRIAPMLDIREAAALMQRAGFALPVVDSERIEVSYESAWHLMRDLRGMGQNSALSQRPRTFTPKALFEEAARIYQKRFTRVDGRVTAYFEVLTLTGWAPAPTQQKPLRPGSAQASLIDALA